MRPSKPWAPRSKGVVCPLDVRGGTWIGINDRGTFCGIVNWDVGHRRGMQSRGMLVFDMLKKDTVAEADDFIRGKDPTNYNGFHLVLLGSKGDGFVYSGNYNMKEIAVTQVNPGFHILTNEGLDLENDAKRNFILWKAVETMGYGKMDEHIMNGLLRLHGPTGEFDEKSVCVHDQDHRWETVSSSVIVGFINNRFTIKDYEGGNICKQKTCNTLSV
jgi:uncharacterized protein with NRDE domain